MMGLWLRRISSVRAASSHVRHALCTATASTETASLLRRSVSTTLASESKPSSIREWGKFAVGLGVFYAADTALKKATVAAGINFPASLIGMFGILGGLWGLSAAGRLGTAEAIVAAATPALQWVTRYLPLFYVPALIVVPLAVGHLSTAELGKMGVVLSFGMPLSLYAAGTIVLGFRKLASVEMLPPAPVKGLPPFSFAHVAACLVVVAVSGLAMTQFEAGSSELWGAQQLFLLASTVGGLIFGSFPPAPIAPYMPHPVIATTAAAHLACLASGSLAGGGYWEALRSYLTKGKEGAPKGAGDLLMSFLGVVVLTFGFHIYGQRALLARHAAEIVGCAALASILSLVATVGAGRALGLDPDLSLALAPRSVTVALAMPIAEQLGVDDDLISVCAASVLVTGLFGAVLCQRLLTLGGFADPLVRGLATAAACHGFGAAALAATEPAALPFAALGYGLSGISASVWVVPAPVRTLLQTIAGKKIE